MTKAFRVLVVLAVGFGAVGVICGGLLFIGLPQERSSFFLLGSLVSGTADLLRTPALVIALASAVGAVFLRAVAWRGRPPLADPLREPREP